MKKNPMKGSLDRWFPFLVFFSVLAALKMVFFAVGLDEEYQLVMAYRNIRGDRLFLEMWEPHQSSAFLCAILMKPWLALFGTTGVVLYLRLWGTLLHLGVSLYLGRVLKDYMEPSYARMLALVYFNTIPKQIILPEFGMMQVWFYTLTALFLARYYGGKKRYLVLAAFSLVLNVLAYPSCLVLFPFLLALIWCFSGKGRWGDMGILASVCVLCGAGYLGMLFTYTTPEELLRTLSHILEGDVTHSLSLGGKVLSLRKGMGYLAALLGGCVVPAFAVARLRKLGWLQMWCLTAVFACGAELFCWLVLGWGYEKIQVHLVAFALAGVCANLGQKAAGTQGCSAAAGQGAGTMPTGASEESPDMRSSEAAPSAEVSDAGHGMAGAVLEPAQRKFLYFIMFGALLSLLAVMYLTDLSFMESVPHAMPAAFCGGILLLFAAEGQGKTKNRKILCTVLLVWCLTAIFGKGYTLRSGTGGYNNVLQSGGILREGPAAGTISNYIGAYIYNCDYEDWQSYIQDGDRVLIMVDQVMNLGTIQYLFRDVEISHFSIVNPTAYDQRLLEYWTLYPEKFPNVIIVDCWYGQLMTDPKGWMMEYIEEEFGYTQVNDGRYIRIYRR